MTKETGKWKMGIVGELITGRGGIERAAWIKTRTGSNLEQAPQQLYPLELSCDLEPRRAQNVLSINVVEFTPRREMMPAARDARGCIASVARDKNN